MTAEDERLRELAEAATPGPWMQSAFTEHVHRLGVDVVVADDPSDAAFIAAANPAAVLALLDRVAAAEAAVERVWEVLANTEWYPGYPQHRETVYADDLRRALDGDR